MSTSTTETAKELVSNCPSLHSCVFDLFTRSSVISVNLHNFHVLSSIKPEDAPVAREMAEDLRLCIAGARVSDHSKDMLPAYDTVRLKILDMLKSVEAAAVAE